MAHLLARHVVGGPAQLRVELWEDAPGHEAVVPLAGGSGAYGRRWWATRAWHADGGAKSETRYAASRGEAAAQAERWHREGYDTLPRDVMAAP